MKVKDIIDGTSCLERNSWQNLKKCKLIIEYKVGEECMIYMDLKITCGQKYITVSKSII